MSGESESSLQACVFLRRDLFNTWCSLGDSLNLPSHDRIAEFLFQSYAKTSEAERKCSCCGSPVPSLCSFCLLQDPLQQQQSQLLQQHHHHLEQQQQSQLPPLLQQLNPDPLQQQHSQLLQPHHHLEQQQLSQPPHLLQQFKHHHDHDHLQHEQLPQFHQFRIPPPHHHQQQRHQQQHQQDLLLPQLAPSRRQRNANHNPQGDRLPTRTRKQSSNSANISPNRLPSQSGFPDPAANFTSAFESQSQFEIKEENVEFETVLLENENSDSETVDVFSGAGLTEDRDWGVKNKGGVVLRTENSSENFESSTLATRNHSRSSDSGMLTSRSENAECSLTTLSLSENSEISTLATRTRSENSERSTLATRTHSENSKSRTLASRNRSEYSEGALRTEPCSETASSILRAQLRGGQEFEGVSLEMDVTECDSDIEEYQESADAESSEAMCRLKVISATTSATADLNTTTIADTSSDTTTDSTTDTTTTADNNTTDTTTTKNALTAMLVERKRNPILSQNSVEKPSADSFKKQATESAATSEFTCPECNGTFRTLRNLKIHFAWHARKQTASQNEIRSDHLAWHARKQTASQNEIGSEKSLAKSYEELVGKETPRVVLTCVLRSNKKSSGSVEKCGDESSLSLSSGSRRLSVEKLSDDSSSSLPSASRILSLEKRNNDSSPSVSTASRISTQKHFVSSSQVAVETTGSSQDGNVTERSGLASNRQEVVTDTVRVGSSQDGNVTEKSGLASSSQEVVTDTVRVGFSQEGNVTERSGLTSNSQEVVTDTVRGNCTHITDVGERSSSTSSSQVLGKSLLLLYYDENLVEMQAVSCGNSTSNSRQEPESETHGLELTVENGDEEDEESSSAFGFGLEFDCENENSPLASPQLDSSALQEFGFENGESALASSLLKNLASLSTPKLSDKILAPMTESEHSVGSQLRNLHGNSALAHAGESSENSASTPKLSDKILPPVAESESSVGSQPGNVRGISALAQAGEPSGKQKQNLASSKNIEARTCPICSNVLSSVSKLHRHMQTHTKEKNFECIECAKRFAYKSSLVEHHRLYHDVRQEPLKCKKCREEFVTLALLQSHKMETHSKNKPFGCSYEGCTSRFYSRRDLERHVRSHEGVRPFRCDLCGKDFMSSSYLYRHKKAVHDAQESDKQFFALTSATESSDTQAPMVVLRSAQESSDKQAPMLALSSKESSNKQAPMVALTSKELSDKLGPMAALTSATESSDTQVPMVALTSAQESSNKQAPMVVLTSKESSNKQTPIVSPSTQEHSDKRTPKLRLSSQESSDTQTPTLVPSQGEESSAKQMVSTQETSDKHTPMLLPSRDKDDSVAGESPTMNNQFDSAEMNNQFEEFSPGASTNGENNFESPAMNNHFDSPAMDDQFENFLPSAYPNGEVELNAEENRIGVNSAVEVESMEVIQSGVKLNERVKSTNEVELTEVNQGVNISGRVKLNEAERVKSTDKVDSAALKRNKEVNQIERVKLNEAERVKSTDEVSEGEETNQTEEEEPNKRVKSTDEIDLREERTDKEEPNERGKPTDEIDQREEKTEGEELNERVKSTDGIDPREERTQGEEPNEREKPTGEGRKNRQFQCTYPGCSRIFLHRGKLIQHRKTAHKNVDLNSVEARTCRVCDKVLSSVRHLHRHMLTHTGEKNFECLDCGKRFGYKTSLLDHQRQHNHKGEHEHKPEKDSTTNSSLNNKHLCTYLGCGQVFPYRQHLRTHILTVHNVSLKSEEIRTCGVCSKVLSSVKHLHRHMLIHTGEKFECTHCGKCFGYKTSLLSHQRIHQITLETKSIKQYRCTYEDCSQIFPNLPDLKEHLRGVHNVDPNSKEARTCGICSTVLSTFFHLHRHLEMHSEKKKKNFECEKCGARFERKTSLLKHVRCTHEGKKKKQAVCDECGKLFARSYLEYHKLSHRSAKPFPCSHHGCGKSYIFKSELKRHALTHTGVRPFKCDVCDQDFTRSNRLRSHKIRAHEAVKPFACDQCQKSFATKQDLARHAANHTDLTPFQCTLCEKRYKLPHMLRVHVKRSHGEKKCTCEVCGRQFFDGHDLDRHMLTHSEIYPFPCDLCPAKFRRKNRLSEHKLLRHPTGEPVKHETGVCQTCGKWFVTERRLRDHVLRIHTPRPVPRIHACVVCDAKFKTVHDLKIHRRRHAHREKVKCPKCPSYVLDLRLHLAQVHTDRSFKCEICNKVFKHASNLHKHRRTHSDEPPRYACQYCGKRFHENVRLQYHVNQHTGEKPYRCQTCGAAFRQPGNLSQHLKIHTGEKPHACKICGKRFIATNDRNKHERTHAGTGTKRKKTGSQKKVGRKKGSKKKEMYSSSDTEISETEISETEIVSENEVLQKKTAIQKKGRRKKEMLSSSETEIISENEVLQKRTASRKKEILSSSDTE